MPCKALLTVLATLAASLTTACSSKYIPRPPDPVCGKEIRPHQVQVVDLTGLQGRQDLMDEALAERVGAYRIMTDEPMWIPRRSTTGNRERPGSISGVQHISADWGCNLLVLLDWQMDRNDVRTQSRNEERIFLVHAGMRQGSR